MEENKILKCWPCCGGGLWQTPWQWGWRGSGFYQYLTCHKPEDHGPTSSIWTNFSVILYRQWKRSALMGRLERKGYKKEQFPGEGTIPKIHMEYNSNSSSRPEEECSEPQQLTDRMTEWKYSESTEMAVVTRSQDDLYNIVFPSMLLLVNKKLQLIRPNPTE